MSSSRQRRHTALLNDIPADILDTLTQSDLSILNYLDKLAREGGGDACTASIPKMADACGISKRQVQISAKKLIDADLIKRVGYDFSNPDRSKRGTVYRVLYKAGGVERTVTVKERKRTIKFLLIWSEE